MLTALQLRGGNIRNGCKKDSLFFNFKAEENLIPPIYSRVNSVGSSDVSAATGAGAGAGGVSDAGVAALAVDGGAGAAAGVGSVSVNHDGAVSSSCAIFIPLLSMFIYDKCFGITVEDDMNSDAQETKYTKF